MQERKHNILRAILRAGIWSYCNPDVYLPWRHLLCKHVHIMILEFSKIYIGLHLSQIRELNSSSCFFQIKQEQAILNFMSKKNY